MVAVAGVAIAGDPPVFSHEDWTAVLERFVDDKGFVDYRALLSDRVTFDRYVRSIETTSPTTEAHLFPTRRDALAYYINTYNALVFKGVLERGPEEKSVWRGLVSGLRFFVLMKVEVGGESMSLKALEDKLIREQFGDPRIHAALNCASVSCPRLPRRAFLGAELDMQLDAAMAEFANNPDHVFYQAEKGTVRLSKIFDWYKSDFLDFERSRGGSDSPRLLDYINRYRSSADRIPGDLEPRFLPYDKGINAR